MSSRAPLWVRDGYREAEAM